jgi:hypothetical protein
VTAATGLTLYQVADTYLQSLKALQESDLPDDVIRDTIEGLPGEFEEKARNVAAYFGNRNAEAEAIRSAAKSMLERAEQIDKESARLQAYLHEQMVRTGIHEISCPYFVVRVRKNPPKVVITDHTKVDPFYFKVQPPPEPTLDKDALKRDLKAGKQLEWARLESGTRLEFK